MTSVVITVVAMLATAGEAAPGCDGLSGVPRARCEVAGTLAEPLCDPLDARVGTTLTRSLEATDRVLARAEAARTAARRRRLVRAADRRLVAAGRRVEKAARRGRVSGACRAVVDARLAAVRAVLAATAPPPLPGLPGDTAGFEQWLRLNATPLPPGSAHGGEKSVYVNRERAVLAPDGAQRLPYPGGTVLVKAALSPAGDFIALVAVMRKRAGSDPAHGDWTFVEFTRDSPAARFRVIARDGVCWSCHAQARARDWVFTPLE